VNLPLLASWSQNATTVAGQANGNSGSSASYLNAPSGISITIDDILYIADSYNNRVVVVSLATLTVINIIGSGSGTAVNKFRNPNDVFVTETSLYVVDTNNTRIQKWSLNGTNPSTMPGAGTFGFSYYMFIDKYDNTYVSLYTDNKVIMFTPNSSVSVTVAGDGTSGSQSDRLNTPYGIFVDDNLTLYVADRNNHRIQMWMFGASSGKTVAGDGSSGNSLNQLDSPNAVAADANGYIYIADTGNNRIVRWGPNSTIGICIAACTNTYGTNMNQLNYPTGLAFDSNGSLYIVEYNNNRVQKFQIFKNQSKN
jgi:sugar lactone lactonase YvrE